MNRYYIAWTCESSNNEVAHTMFYYRLNTSALRGYLKKRWFKWNLKDFFDDDKMYLCTIDAKNEGIVRKIIKANFNKVKFKVISKKENDYVITVDNELGHIISSIRRKNRDDYIKDRLSAI